MRSPLARINTKWKTDIVLVRSAGRDAKGNPLPETRSPVKACLVAPRATSEPLARGDLVDAAAVLYREEEDGLDFLSKDRIEVPEGARMAGVWSVEGRPKLWPFGWEVALKGA